MTLRSGDVVLVLAQPDEHIAPRSVFSPSQRRPEVKSLVIIATPSPWIPDRLFCCDLSPVAERRVGSVTFRRSCWHVSVGSRGGGETFNQTGELVGVVCGDDDTEAVAPAQHGVLLGGERAAVAADGQEER